MPEPTAEPDTPLVQTVESRNPSGNAIGITFALLAVLTFLVPLMPRDDGSSMPPERRFPVYIVSALLLLIAAIGVWHSRRAHIVADNDGLRWHNGFFAERTGTWGQVSDYYISDKTGVPIIETTVGTIHLMTDYTKRDDLKRAVAERATDARTREWKLRGARRGDSFPRTFRYVDRATVWEMAVPVATFLALFAVAAVFGWQKAVEYAALIGWRETLPSVIVGLIGFALLAVVPALNITYSVAAWKRRDCTITVTPETVRFDDAATGKQIEADWRDVTDYFHRNGDAFLVLRGAGETQIEWSSHLRERHVLLAIVQTFAPTPALATGGAWRTQTKAEATNGDDPTTWQSGAVGIGGRVFHNRSGYHRSLITIGMVLAAFVALPFVLHPTKEKLSLLRVLLAGAAAWFAWAWYVYFRVRVETDDIGITLTAPFGVTHLPWFTVADYSDVQDSLFRRLILTGRNDKRMVFWNTLHGYDTLREEITQHAPPPQTGWTPRPDAQK